MNLHIVAVNRKGYCLELPDPDMKLSKVEEELKLALENLGGDKEKLWLVVLGRTIRPENDRTALECQALTCVRLVADKGDMEKLPAVFEAAEKKLKGGAAPSEEAPPEDEPSGLRP